MAARNFLPRCTAFFNPIPIESLKICDSNAMHLGKKLLAAIFSALVGLNVPTGELYICGDCFIASPVTSLSLIRCFAALEVRYIFLRTVNFYLRKSTIMVLEGTCLYLLSSSILTSDE